MLNYWSIEREEVQPGEWAVLAWYHAMRLFLLGTYNIMRR